MFPVKLKILGYRKVREDYAARAFEVVKELSTWNNLEKMKVVRTNKQTNSERPLTPSPKKIHHRQQCYVIKLVVLKLRGPSYLFLVTITVYLDA